MKAASAFAFGNYFITKIFHRSCYCSQFWNATSRYSNITLPSIILNKLKWENCKFRIYDDIISVQEPENHSFVHFNFRFSYIT
jgi:hypothetical protein